MTENKILSDEQYQILLEGTSYFEEYSKIAYCRSIDPRFLTRMKGVHDDFFCSPLNVNCSSCIGSALSKLWYHMGVKKYDIEQKELINVTQNAQTPTTGINKRK